jgi:hypothetical protein
LYSACNTVKLLIQCATGAFVFVTTCIAAMILCITREWIVGMVATSTLLSPGLLLMSAVYRETGGIMRDTLFARIAALTPAIFINVAIYPAAFFGLAKLARKLVLKRAVPGQPATDDERPKTTL